MVDLRKLRKGMGPKDPMHKLCTCSLPFMNLFFNKKGEDPLKKIRNRLQN